MIIYHKIQSMFKRDPENNYKNFLDEYSLPAFAVLADLPWLGTEKVDGMNIRVSSAAIGGRSDNAQIPGDLRERLEAIQGSLAASDLPEDTTLIGEGYGAGIQSGGAYGATKQFVLFDIHINGRYVERDVMLEIAELLNIETAPLIAPFTLPVWADAIQNGFAQESHLVEGAPNEGVVLRPPVELYDSYGNRMITKLKFKDYA